jgi:hypothetical protein
VNKREKDDPLVGSKRKPALKLAKGSDSVKNGADMAGMEAGAMEIEDVEMQDETERAENTDGGENGGTEEEKLGGGPVDGGAGGGVY